VIRSEKTALTYERSVQPAPKLGEWVSVLGEILEQEAKLPRRERRSTKLPRRERRSTQRLFEELRGRGYDGAHDRLHRFTRTWREEHARVPSQAYVPLSFAPGEAYQFDGSHETITLHGLPLVIKAAHMKLSHSRMPFVRAYFRGTQELVFDAPDKAFGFYGGVCRRGIYDNPSRALRVDVAPAVRSTAAAGSRNYGLSKTLGQGLTPKPPVTHALDHTGVLAPRCLHQNVGGKRTGLRACIAKPACREWAMQATLETVRQVLRSCPGHTGAVRGRQPDGMAVSRSVRVASEVFKPWSARDWLGLDQIAPAQWGAGRAGRAGRFTTRTAASACCGSRHAASATWSPSSGTRPPLHPANGCR